MAPGVSEVDAATTVVGVDLARSLAAGVRPVLQPPRLDLAEDRVEVVLGNQKRVMLRAYLLGRIGVVVPCSSCTARKRPNGTGLGSPNSSLTNSADSRLSRAATMV